MQSKYIQTYLGNSWASSFINLTWTRPAIHCKGYATKDGHSSHKEEAFCTPRFTNIPFEDSQVHKRLWHLLFSGTIFVCFGSLGISMNFTLMKQIVGAWHDSKTANLNTHTHIHCWRWGIPTKNDGASSLLWDKKSWGWHRAKIISTSVCNLQHFLLDPLEEPNNYSHCPYAGGALTFFIISL